MPRRRMPSVWYVALTLGVALAERGLFLPHALPPGFNAATAAQCSRAAPSANTMDREICCLMVSARCSTTSEPARCEVGTRNVLCRLLGLACNVNASPF